MRASGTVEGTRWRRATGTKEDEMNQGAYVTLVGYVAQEPSIRTTKTGKVVTELRVGIAPRYRDRATGEWRDAESSYFSVSCWERLAHHVRASMHKGEPVLVRGRFKTNTFEDKDGRPRTETKITADVVGHDLSRGVANYIRQRSKQQAADADAAGDQAQGNPDQPGGPDEMLDEEAIERFGRDLDDADLAARALAEDSEDSEDPEDGDAEDGDSEDGDEDDDTAQTAASATPY
jgi:single-strand DNA-binding protein